MDNYQPVMSFGDDAAETYYELSRRGDEVAAAAAAEGGQRSFPEEVQNGTRMNADLHESIDIIFKDAHCCAAIYIFVK